MFHSKKAYGLALLFSAVFLTGCGGDDANKQSLALCEGEDAGGILQPDGSCAVRPPSCPTGQVRDENGECGAPPFAGPLPIYQPAEDEAVIYYNRQRSDQTYDGFFLYRFNTGACDAWFEEDLEPWPSTDAPDGASLAGTPAPEGALLDAVPPDGVDPLYGAFWVVRVRPGTSCGNYIINEDANDNQTSDSTITVDNDGPFARMAFVIAPDSGVLGTSVVGSTNPVCPGYDPADIAGNPGDCTPPPPARRKIINYAAHWIDESTLVWSGLSPEAVDVALWSSSTGGMTQDSEGNIIAGTEGEANLLAVLDPVTLSDAQREEFPHFANEQYAAFSLDVSREAIKTALTGQLWLIAEDGIDALGDPRLIGTNVQTANVIDALYTSSDDDADEAVLGVQYHESGISVSAWAPTAQNMRIKLYSGESGGARVLNAVEAMTLDTSTGIWRYDGDTSLDGAFYIFEVTVYDPEQSALVVVETSDPYSVSLSVDSLFSQFVNLSDDALKPAGWDDHTIPTIAYPEDAIIYEGHIRDFSIRDESTSAEHRGKYLAFTEDSVPVQHLRTLAEKGLTHFHMLPSFDMARVVEASEYQTNLNDTIGSLCERDLSDAINDICSAADPNATIAEVFAGFDPATQDAGILTSVLKEVDGFNWGYDPYHFNVPEGSYASSPEGGTRIVEKRAMIQALHELGLRVVMDVVYNHTAASGFTLQSTFDQLVPGYYYRRDPVTGVVEGETCCEDTASEHRMMAKFMSDSLVQWAREYKIDAFRFDLMGYHPKAVIDEALLAVRTVDEDTYFYGEGWDTGGSTGGNAKFEQATQLNMSGTGIGTFNNRMRNPLQQAALFKGESLDAIRAGLAGNLADFEFYSSGGQLIPASNVGAYGADPQENIAYASKHDNEALWDWLHMDGALPIDMSMENRARAQVLTLAIPLLSQGVSFVHMGSDLLRSKSFEEDSYDAGDWFNFVDFTQSDNNWNVGLPEEMEPPADGSFRQRILARPEADPNAATIAWASDAFNDLLEVSTSSRLFNLTSSEAIAQRIGFHNQGTSQTESVIVMSLDDGISLAADFDNLDADQSLEDLDPSYDAIVLIINGSEEAIAHQVNSASGFSLHPLQASGADEHVKQASFDNDTATFSVPALSAAVFVKAQANAQGYGLFAGASPAPGGSLPNPFGAGTVLYLRGVNNDWSTSTPMRYDAAGNFTAFATLTADANETFKIADAQWETQFTAVDPVMAGENQTLINGDGQGDTAFEVPVAGVYRFNLDASIPEAPVLNVALAESYAAKPIYARGVLGEWGTTRELEYQGQSIYSGVFSLTAGDTALKIADADWGGGDAPTGFNFGVADDVAPYIAGEGTLTLNNIDGSNGDIELTLPVDGDYLIKIDARNPNAPILSVVLADPFAGTTLYVRGVNSDWGTTYPLVFQGNAIYSADIVVTEASSEKFKIADADWSPGTNFGAESSVYFNESVVFRDGGPDAFFAYATEGEGDAASDEDGRYTFTLDMSKGQVEVLVVPNPL